MTTPNFFGTVLKAVACTRNHNFDKASYEQGVIQPAKRIRAMMRECGENRPNTTQIQESFALLKTIFETKQVGKQEQQMRFNEIIERNNLQSLSPQINPIVSVAMPASALGNAQYAHG